MRSRAIPTAIRTCSTRTGTMMAIGSMPTMTDLTTTGTTMAALRSLPRNSLHFSPCFSGEFCFSSKYFKTCPFQPPSILPTSSIFKERAIYFLSSKDFVSQSTINNTFTVSVFLIANLIQGCFSPLLKKLATAIPSIISTNRLSILTPRECR